MKSDVEIAQEAAMADIREIAAQLDFTEDDLELYGKYKAKLAINTWNKIKNNKNGKINPKNPFRSCIMPCLHYNSYTDAEHRSFRKCFYETIIRYRSC